MGASGFSLQASGLGMREKPMQELLGLDIRRQEKKDTENENPFDHPRLWVS